MALINKKDFSIISTNQDHRTQDDYFECDDLIAPAIALLNKKGYKTECCCSGHAFPNIDAEARKEYPSWEEIDDPDVEILWTEPSDKVSLQIDQDFDEEEYPWFVIAKYNFCSMFYVTFEEWHEFPELPEGAEIDEDNGGIYWTWDNYPKPTENFDAMMKIFEINKIFYEWVEKLPNLV